MMAAGLLITSEPPLNPDTHKISHKATAQIKRAHV